MRRPLILLTISICCACGQASERTIPYRSDRSIAERLVPGDTKVLVEMKQSSPPASPSRQETFEQEIQRLKKSEVIVLARISSAAGEMADRGTWVRTRIRADVERVVRANRELGPAIEFTYSGGNARIGSVEVSTGKFP